METSTCVPTHQPIISPLPAKVRLTGSAAWIVMSTAPNVREMARRSEEALAICRLFGRALDRQHLLEEASACAEIAERDLTPLAAAASAAWTRAEAAAARGVANGSWPESSCGGPCWREVTK